MIIFIKSSKIKKFIIVVLLLMVFTLGLYPYRSLISTHAFVSTTEDELEKIVQEIFDKRNKAALAGDIESLEKIFDIETRNGGWAYEREVSKNKYLEQWQEKQASKFSRIDSKVFLRSVKEVKDGYQLNLAVTTEYIYYYEEDSTEYDNSSRTGTYHSIDLINKGKDWKIAREWFADPLGNASELKQRDVDYTHEIILSKEAKDLSDLSQARKNALEYADKYSGVARPPDYSFQYNLDYKNYNSLGGNCTNYVSQVIHEGGMSKTSAWNYTGGDGNRAWVNASTFHNYMIYSGRGSLIASGTYEQVLEHSYSLLPGDYIAFERKGKIVHNVIVSGVDSKGYTLVNGNNPDVYRVPWDFGWSNEGVKFHLVRVNYW